MKYIFYVIIVTFLLASTAVLTSSAFAEELVLSAESKKLEYKYNQTPSIFGIVTDMDGNPMSKVSVYASFPYIKSENNSSDSNSIVYSSTIIGFTTFSDGKFLLNPTNPSPPGEHTIKVTAKTDQTEENIFVTFNVKEDGNIIKKPITSDTKASIETAKLSYSVLEQKMETQKGQYKKIKNPTDNLVAEQQVAEQQVAEQQVAEQQVAEQQVAEQQVAEQQVAEQ
ncbi:MAG: hypothetical protein OEM21_09195, partial [Nitrosopumilus sp.]|nr:hypothetical protein [Nitrosopumilus sp.]